jgi:hypothetical protein
MGRACSTQGAKCTAYKMLVGNPEGRRPLGMPGLSCENSIKIGLR